MRSPEATVRRYEPLAIEARRQEAWQAGGAFRVSPPRPGRAEVYLHAVSPFASGRLHLGHVRAYTLGDAYARYRRARGDGVLFTIGFDSFGLPAELAAIAAELPTRTWVDRCCARMTVQMRRLGLSFDWERRWVSCDEDMYRWSQWLFLAFAERGLVYRETGTADWCDGCSTTLAALQVENGRCWRCGGAVRLVERSQWRLRIRDYAEESEERLAAMQGWEATARGNQRTMLGRVEGAEVEARAPDGRALWTFTPHADAVGAARFVLLSPRHPDVERWSSSEARAELRQIRLEGRQRAGRHAEQVALVDAGATVRVRGIATPLPVAISPVVDGRFGVTAVLGVPARDRTDAILARRLGLDSAPESSSATVAGVRAAVRHRIEDLSISRQRSWGTPIPIVHCDACGEVPVPEDDLPVVLPRELMPSATGHALAECEDFVRTRCPACGAAARRETDTLDCHFDALWLWVPQLVPQADRAERMFDHPELSRWLPGEIVFGADGGGFLLDQRFAAKALRDIGPLSRLRDGEPFARATVHEMVVQDGRKMSKHLGNVVDPDDVVERYGADALRLAVLYAVRPQKPLSWSDEHVRHCARFLSEVWECASACFASRPLSGADAVIDRTDARRRALAQHCDVAVRKAGEDLADRQMQRAVRAIMTLLERIQAFARRASPGGEWVEADAHAHAVALGVLVRLLAPFAPHLGEELWIASGAGDGSSDPPWPDRW